MEKIEIKENDWESASKGMSKILDKEFVLNGETWKVLIKRSTEKEDDEFFRKESDEFFTDFSFGSDRYVTISRNYEQPTRLSSYKHTVVDMELREAGKSVRVRCVYNDKLDRQPWLRISYDQDFLPQLESVAKLISESFPLPSFSLAIDRMFNYIKLCDDFIDKEEQKRSYFQFKNVVAVSSKDASFVPLSILLVGSRKKRFNIKGEEIIENARPRYEYIEGYNTKGDKIFDFKYGKVELSEQDDCYAIYPWEFHDMSRCPFVCIRNPQGGKPSKPETITLAQEQDLGPYIQSFFGNLR